MDIIWRKRTAKTTTCFSTQQPLNKNKQMQPNKPSYVKRKGLSSRFSKGFAKQMSIFFRWVGEKPPTSPLGLRVFFRFRAISSSAVTLRHLRLQSVSMGPAAQQMLAELFRGIQKHGKLVSLLEKGILLKMHGVIVYWQCFKTLRKDVWCFVH